MEDFSTDPDLTSIDWEKIKQELDDNGYVVLPKIISDDSCRRLIEMYGADNTFRKTITMEHHGYGKGEYKYFNYPLHRLFKNLGKAFMHRLLQLRIPGSAV